MAALARGGSEDILYVRYAGNRWFGPSESDRVYLNIHDWCTVPQNDRFQGIAVDDGVLRTDQSYTIILAPGDRVEVENVPFADQDQ